MILGLAAAFSSACAPLYGSAFGPRARGWAAAPAPAAIGPSLNLAAVTGRWDNVMMLPKEARIRVLQMDGVQAEGEVVSVAATALKLRTAGGEFEIAAEQVARIDRVGSSRVIRSALSGAAHGAGAVGLLGLIVGDMPPARLFAAGAIAGGEAGLNARPGGDQTVYISPRVRQ